MKATAEYWETRYATGGGSGRGSRGHPAHLKAGYVNRAVQKHDIKTILDIGCGDGYVARMIQHRDYFGYDPSLAAVIIAKKQAPQHNFGYVIGEPREAHLSMDVIRHLVDEDDYHHHLEHLFEAERMVMVWSSNKEKPWSFYERERRWTPDVPDGWRLAERSNPLGGSRFYVYLRAGE